VELHAPHGSSEEIEVIERIITQAASEQARREADQTSSGYVS
jgi:hypothetical protein